MTIEEKFNQDILWFINELQSDMLATNLDTVRFIFTTEKDAPLERQQHRILNWLADLGIIEVLGNIYGDNPIFRPAPLFESPVVGKKLKVNKSTFSALRKTYESVGRVAAEEIIEKARGLKTTKVETPLPPPPKLPVFDKETRRLTYRDKKIDIAGANQFAVCKKLFAVNPGNWIGENDVVDGFISENKQSFYDAQRLLNARIGDELGIKNLIEYKTSRVRLNPETIKKLTES